MYRSDDRAFAYTARPAFALDEQLWVVGRARGALEVVQLYRSGGRFHQRRPGRAPHGDYDYPTGTTRAELRDWWERDFDDGRYELVFDAAELADTMAKWDGGAARH